MTEKSPSPDGEIRSAGLPEASPGLGEVFAAFLTIGVIGFGGLAPAATHVIVERKKWYSPKEFVELFALCSILPGGNILNASIIIGNRFQGVPGALAAIGALLLLPLVILVALALTYESFSHLPDVRAATAGAASAAAGMIVGTAAKLIRGVEKSWTSVAFCLATFLSIGILRFPLQLTLLVVLPLAIGWSFYRRRGGRG